jgi:aspartyl-tRNA(Asn)/glutamyl-tRNA(Gln) amidotransferase subunit A
MAIPGDLTTLTIQAVHEGFADGAFNAVELTRAHLARITEVNSHYNAIIFTNQNALGEAADIDRRRATGEAIGPLAGIPFVAKDTMNVAGFPTTGGWSLLSSRAGGIDLIAEKDCCVVARMRAAGAILLGKTNVPVLSATGTHADDSWAGPTLNGVDDTLVPGGSSAGTATAVALGMALVGLAEETGGSIQNPASVHGLVGAKPSFGLVSNAGVMPLGASTLDVMGPIARTVRDAALVLDVLAGYSPEDPKTIAGIGTKPAAGYACSLDSHKLAGKRLGLYGPGWRKPTKGRRGDPLSPEIEVAYRQVQKQLKAHGVALIDDPFLGMGFADLAEIAEGGDEYDPRGMESLPYDLTVFLRSLGPNAALKDFAEFCDATRSEDPFAPTGVLNYLGGVPDFEACRADPDTPPPLTDFFAARAAYLSIFNEVMERFSLDALVFPQMCDPAPKRGAGIPIRETTVAELNIAGLPGVTVPAGRLETGQKFNLIFVGRMWSEALLLGLAHDFEGTFGA